MRFFSKKRWRFQKKTLSLSPMKTLYQHIECLLLRHECVVVPHFGAFVVRENPATRVEAEGLFFPPSRLIRFNPDVVDDDLLLVNAVRDERHLTTSEAKRAIQGMVLGMRQQLLADGQVDFGSIGLFTQDEDGHLSFSACQAGITTPVYYGLDAFIMRRLTMQPTTANQQQATASRIRHRRPDSHIVISIPRRALRAVTAAAAIIVLCLLVSNPFNIENVRSNQAAVISTETICNDDTTIQPTPSTTVEVTDDQHAATEPETETSVTEETNEQKGYAVVLASNVSRRNAEAFVAKLHEKGFEDARIFDNGKMLRVIIDGMTSETEASNFARQIHALGSDYASAWVMKL